MPRLSTFLLPLLLAAAAPTQSGPAGTGTDPSAWTAKKALDDAKALIAQLEAQTNAQAPKVRRASTELRKAFDAYSTAPLDAAARQKLVGQTSDSFEMVGNAFGEVLASEKLIDASFDQYHADLRAAGQKLDAEAAEARNRAGRARDDLTQVEAARRELLAKAERSPDDERALRAGYDRFRQNRRDIRNAEVTAQSLDSRRAMLQTAEDRLGRARVALKDQFHDLRDKAGSLAAMSTRLQTVLVAQEVESALGGLRDLGVAMKNLGSDGDFMRTIATSVGLLEQPLGNVDDGSADAQLPTTAFDAWRNAPIDGAAVAGGGQ